MVRDVQLWFSIDWKLKGPATAGRAVVHWST
jgi:hypothetical protein